MSRPSYGEAGFDTMYGDGFGFGLTEQGGHDSMYGGADGDTLYGDGADDGPGGGNDHLIGGDGYDSMYAEGGNDRLISRDLFWEDWVDGGSGTDTAFAATDTDDIDFVLNVENR